MRWAIPLATLSILACGKDADVGPVKTPDALSAGHEKWAGAIANADSVVLYEGLPHQFYDGEALKKDLKDKKTVTLHGFPFYAETLSLKAEDAAELKTLASDTASYTVASGTKKCGGFHPDYCVEWIKNGQTYRLLVCFGCGEVKFFGPKIELYCDTDHVRVGFGKTLRQYQKHRTAFGGP